MDGLRLEILAEKKGMKLKDLRTQVGKCWVLLILDRYRFGLAIIVGLLGICLVSQGIPSDFLDET